MRTLRASPLTAHVRFSAPFTPRAARRSLTQPDGPAGRQTASAAAGRRRLRARRPPGPPRCQHLHQLFERAATPPGARHWRATAAGGRHGLGDRVHGVGADRAGTCTTSASSRASRPGGTRRPLHRQRRPAPPAAPGPVAKLVEHVQGQLPRRAMADRFWRVGLAAPLGVVVPLLGQNSRQSIGQLAWSVAAYTLTPTWQLATLPSAPQSCGATPTDQRPNFGSRCHRSPTRPG